VSLDSNCKLAEGVSTVKALVDELARESGPEMPLNKAVHSMIYEGLSAEHVMRELMGRPLKKED
ncbi:MAG: glycerol-3-phosphate dehydrogenase, partial [Planctomycetes bacterium]|nr:glycerol-3-phosphate dehydrogenase [Planctomycetota bacterium]